ncbi:hypothetical protein CNMCM6106_003223 [Aspergillus hiratsukae]|uniref:Enoyl reductase (ER) domain-containing protein n=1 Tax=Aspergillus hiratsukae TaxID=1194566 RepID=A0A8H6UYW0_9EURO|nr:hypothetical protein CNMCM6106_003223 [Aspergillus hiratsukae]
MAPTLPSSMRALQWTTTAGGIEKNLKLQKAAPLPKNAAQLPVNSTLVKISFASVNPFDYKFPELPIANLILAKPGIPCFDYAGTVVQSTRSSVKAGDRVFGRCDIPNFGALAEYAVISQKGGCVRVPDGVKLEDAATIGTAALTAYQSLVPFVKPGDKVLINGGSGGVGTYAIQICKILGANVTVTCSGKNAELCKSLGADEVIDYQTQDVIDYLLRSGKQYNHIFDTVWADNKFYWQAHNYLQAEGTFVTIAAHPNLSTLRTVLAINFLPDFLTGKKRKFKFVSVSANAEHYEQIAGWMKDGNLKPVIERVYDLEDAAEAFVSFNPLYLYGFIDLF